MPRFPASAAKQLTRLRNDYGNPHVIVTENGCSDPLGTAPAKLDDVFRIDYLRRHMEAVKIEMEKGSPVGGFFVWTLVDNWEWDQGYTAKFGMVAMDRTSGTRTTKKSYAWLAELAKTGLLRSADRSS